MNFAIDHGVNADGSVWVAYESLSSLLYKDGELNDKLIMDTLVSAEKCFQDGAIIEARDMLAEIVNAIDDFDREYNI